MEEESEMGRREVKSKVHFFKPPTELFIPDSPFWEKTGI